MIKATILILLFFSPWFVMRFIFNRIFGKKEIEILNSESEISLKRTFSGRYGNFIGFFYMALLLSLFFYVAANSIFGYIVMVICFSTLVGMVYMGYSDIQKEPLVILLKSKNQIQFRYKDRIESFDLSNASELVFHHYAKKGASLGIIIDDKEHYIITADKRREIKEVNRLLHLETGLETVKRIERGLLSPKITKVPYVD